MFDRDASVAAAAELCLDRNLSLPLGRVTAHIRSGWVTLSGCLDWPFQAEAAEYGLKDIPGVIGLTNCITIRAGHGVSHEDREFAAVSHGCAD